MSLRKAAPAATTPTTLDALPVSSTDLLHGLATDRTFELETRYGNRDFIRILRALGIAGPFKIASPWELEDAKGVRRIHATGYAALPFGEHYPPLVDFVRQYLETSQDQALPNQSASAWRAALEANLVSLLARVAPSHADSRVFFTNSGAEAIETALKLLRAARPRSSYIINFRKAYHGKTLGALSLTPNEEYQSPFRPPTEHVVTVPYGNLELFEAALFKLGPDKVAGVFVEPVQGEGGVVVPPEGFLSGLGQLCREQNVLIVADEVQTGLGRSGYHFASIEWGGLEPDIITLAKPLGGGLLPLSATIARQEIYLKMLGGLKCKSHSTTMGGNTLAMAIGVKSLELLVSENLAQRAQQLGKKGLAKLEGIQRRYPNCLTEVRGLGMLFALQFKTVVNPAFTFGRTGLTGDLSGMLGLRSLYYAGVVGNASLNAGHTVRLTPALNIPEELFDELLTRVEKAARKHPAAWKMLAKTSPFALSRLAKAVLGRD